MSPLQTDRAARAPAEEPTDSESEKEKRLTEAMERYQGALEAGEVDRDALLADYPDLADELPGYLDALDFLRSVDSNGMPSLAGAASLGLDEEVMLGDFRLVRPLGRGGMGIVYEAEQVSLGRTVAVKVLPFAAVLDERRLKRFRVETRAAALLEHPNIVPIYFVGQDRGVHFYAMQLVDGHSLADVIRQWREGRPSALVPQFCRRDTPAEPAGDPGAAEARQQAKGRARLDAVGQVSMIPGREYFWEAARLVLQAADALEHAHSQGIVHRDIKPGNLLVDARGKLWITDFGLAHIEFGDELTMSGAILGTAGYMSPEQAAGSRFVDSRSDIYSLGATFYELLVRRPPLSEMPTKTESESVVGPSLRIPRPADPIPPRRIEPRVPVDLETIVLKAMANHASERYQTAAAMADDLRRFIAGQPILARRPGLVQRTSRWLARHRWSVAAALILLLAASIVSISGLAYHNTRLGRVNAMLRASQARSNQLAYVANLGLAYRALAANDVRYFNEVLSRVAQQVNSDVPAGVEWRFLRQLDRTADSTVATMPEPLYNVAYSPEGQRVAVGGADGRVRLYEVGSWQLATTFDSGQGEVNAVTFSADGRRLATAGDDGSIRLWDAATAEHLRTVEGHPDQAYDVKFIFDDSMLVSCGRDDRILLWDCDSGVLHGTLEGHTDHVEQLAVSPDGRYLASASSDATARIWDLRQQRVVHVLQAGFDRLSSVAYSPDGQWIAVGSLAKTVTTWCTQDGSKISERSFIDPVHSVAVDPTGQRIAVGDRGGAVHICGVDGLTRNESRATHDDRVYCLAWNADGSKIIAAGRDGRITSIELPAKSAVRSLEIGGNVDSAVFLRGTSAANEPRRRGLSRALLAVAAGGDVYAADSRGRILPWVPSAHPGEWWNVAVAADGNGLAAGNRWALVDYWDIDRLEEPELRIDVAGSEPTVISDRKRALEIRQRRETRGDPAPQIRGLALSRSGRLMACTVKDPDGIVVFKMPQMDVVLALAAEDSDRICFSQDERNVAFNERDDVVVFDLENLRLRTRLTGHLSTIRDIAFSSDASLLATCGNDRTIRVWQIDAGRQQYNLTAHRSGVLSVHFASEDRTLVSTTADELAFWDLQTGQQYYAVSPDALGVESFGPLALSRDERYLLAGKHLIALGD